MAETKPMMKRCGERVTMARLRSDFEGSYILGGTVLVLEGAKDGVRVKEMALHPLGLVILPTTGVFKGRRIIVPMAQVVVAVPAEDEQ